MDNVIQKARKTLWAIGLMFGANENDLCYLHYKNKKKRKIRLGWRTAHAYVELEYSYEKDMKWFKYKDKTSEYCSYSTYKLLATPAQMHMLEV